REAGSDDPTDGVVMFGSKKKLTTPPRPRMGCGGWAMLAIAVLIATLLLYDLISGIDWNQAGSDLWETAQAPLMIAGAIIVGLPLLVTGIWAAVLDSPRAVENGAERRWIV